METSSRRERERGQSIVELAIFLPIIVVLFLAVGDLARAFATMITIESGAREAADWGAYRPGNWNTVVPQYPTTIAEMERRACTAALGLPEYEGAADGSSCTNPTFECFIGATNDPSTSCSIPSTCDVDACRLKVKLTYDFDLLMAPMTYTFERSSTFAIGKDQSGTP